MSERPPGATRGRLAGWLVFVGLLAALNYAGRLAADVQPEEDLLYRWSTFAGVLFQFGLMSAILLWIVRGGPARELLALRRPRGWGRAVGSIAVVIVGMTVLGGLLEPVLEPGEEQGLVPDEWEPDRVEPFVGNVVLTVIFVPFVEELVFRGAGYSLLARYGTSTAIVVTALLFGAAHGLVLALPILVAFGLGLAWIRSRVDSVYPCVVLHGAFNLANVLLGVFTDIGSGS